MTRIGSGGPPKAGTVPTAEQTADLKTKEGLQQFKEVAGRHVPQQVVDSFQRAGPALEAKLQNLSGQALAAKLNFTNEDLALLARTFAGILRAHPNATRYERSKLFAKAILQKKGSPKRGKLSRLLDEENEGYDENDRRALEELYDVIAEQLDSTPVFAQLVEDVTESVRKIR
jgi:hypothetical protein